MRKNIFCRTTRGSSWANSNSSTLDRSPLPSVFTNKGNTGAKKESTQLQLLMVSEVRFRRESTKKMLTIAFFQDYNRVFLRRRLGKSSSSTYSIRMFVAKTLNKCAPESYSIVTIHSCQTGLNSVLSKRGYPFPRAESNKPHCDPVLTTYVVSLFPICISTSCMEHTTISLPQAPPSYGHDSIAD